MPSCSTRAITGYLYAGTDLGVYRTTDAGQTWHVFDHGIPHVPVTDLHLDGTRGLLYAATMGRGMYRVCVDPAAEERPVDVYLRDSVLDTGDRSIVPDGVPNPLRPSEHVYWWQSPDVKVVPAASRRDPLDGVEFDLDLPDDPPEPSRPAVVYLQIHNRGWETARDVHARVFYTTAAGLPHLAGPLKPPGFESGTGIILDRHRPDRSRSGRGARPPGHRELAVATAGFSRQVHSAARRRVLRTGSLREPRDRHCDAHSLGQARVRQGLDPAGLGH